MTRSYSLHRAFGVLALIAGAFSFAPAVAQETPISASGLINDRTPFVEVPFTVASGGSTITIDMRPAYGNLDTLLYLVDSQDNIVAQNDDRSREDTSSYIEFPQAGAGDYKVIATRYGVVGGDTWGTFDLTVEVSASAAAAADGQPYRVSADDLVAAGYPEADPRPPADWTILAYYGGDANLEPSALNDFNEFELAGGSNERVRILVLVDRHPAFTDSSGNWETVRVFEVGPDVSGDQDVVFPPTIDTPSLVDLGELDTGAGETLAQFLAWGVQNFPAEHYAVVFSSHGAGWRGLVSDDTDDNDILSVAELAKAFATAAEAAGVARFDLLVNDACSMSSVEYYAGIAPYFALSLASPEIVINPALDMTLFAELLNEDPETVQFDALGRQLIDKYITEDILKADSPDNVYYAGAMTDLGGFEPVAQAIERFAGLVNRDAGQYGDLLGWARARAYTYTFFMGGNTRIDLGDFMQQVAGRADDPGLKQAAQDVIAALDAARIYGSAGVAAGERTSYYNIYFPENGDDFDFSYLVESPLSGWAAMLRSYFNTFTPRVWAGELAYGPQFNMASQGGATYENPLSVSLEGLGDDVAYSTFIVDQIQDDGTVVRMVSTRIPPEGDASFSWNSTLREVTDGQRASQELLVDTGGDVLYLDGRYQDPSIGIWFDVTVIFGREAGTVQRVVSSDPGTGALGVIDIPVGAPFEAYRAVVSPDGRARLEPGTRYHWPEGGLWWVEIMAPSGEYNAGVLVTTYGGSTGYDSITAEVDMEEDTCTSFSHSLPLYFGFGTNFEFEWQPYEGAAWYRLKILSVDATVSAEYLTYGELGIRVPLSDLARPDGQYAVGEYAFEIIALDANQQELCRSGTNVFAIDSILRED